MKPPLPEYDNPPVVEVVISLQFKPLENLRAAHYGVFWQSLKSEGFSKVEDHGELPPVIESYDIQPATPIGLRLLSFDDAPPLPRVWFLDDEQNQLVQLQRDRLVVNWRKPDKLAAYPHYSQIIERFKFALKALQTFAGSEQLGVIALFNVKSLISTTSRRAPTPLARSQFGQISTQTIIFPIQKISLFQFGTG